MMRSLVLTSLLFVAALGPVVGQIIVVPIGLMEPGLTPKQGFLPGKKFKIYPTIEKFDFKGRKLRVELFDVRDKMRLKRVNCSAMELAGKSEFASKETIYTIKQYIDSLFSRSGIIIDSAATDTLKIRFEGIDARLFGFGYVRVHGICQMNMEFHGRSKIYCSDISDADVNSPISPTAVVTRKTATRIMASAAIRNVVEQFLVDLRSRFE